MSHICIFYLTFRYCYYIFTNNVILSIRAFQKRSKEKRIETRGIKRERKIEKVNLPTNQRLLILAPHHYPGFRGFHLLDTDVGRIERDLDQLRRACHCEKFLVTGVLEKFRRWRYRYRLASVKFIRRIRIYGYGESREFFEKYLSRFSRRSGGKFQSYPVLFIAILSKIFF